jgi:hypothetical protein
MRRHCWHVFLTGCLGFALAACRASPTTTPAPEPTLTATLAPSATTVIFPPTWTPDATPTRTPTRAPSATPESTATLALSLTETLAPTETLSPTIEAELTDKAEFVADVTVPDGSPFAAGAAFTKTWRVKNVGTATWTTEYALVFVSGEPMGGPAEAPLPVEVKPEETVDISVALTAPQRLAFYTGFWQLRNTAGEFFGVGAGANEPLYVQIQVTGGDGGGNTTPAPTAPAGALRVTAASLSTISPTVTAPCPYTVIFNGTLTSEGAGTATYQLEAVSDVPGFVFDLPAPFDSRFADAGPRTLAFSYTLEFRNSVSGQVWVHVLSPNDFESPRLSFSLTCQ